MWFDGMKIGIRNFRCFQDIPLVDIRPITLLVRENSTGKTSFLSALRFAHELFQRGTNPSFNKDPYSLGSFKEIAHFRGGRAGRADEFSFYLSSSVRLPRPRVGEDATAEVCIVLREVDSQPAISSIELSAAEYTVDLHLSGKAEFSYKTPNMQASKVFTESLRLPPGYDSPNFNAVSFILRDIPFLISSDAVRRQDSIGQSSREDLNAFAGVLRAIERSFAQTVFAGAPVRTKPARTYDNIEAIPSPEGSHVPYLLARLKAFRPDDWKGLRENLIAFGTAAGLFNDIDVKKFSSSPSSPFQISVNIAGPSSNLVDVGYGVSQALPVVAETLQARRGSLFLLQQPEVHLHPRAQAALGTYLGNIARQRRLTIVIETHSDYLIDRVRMDVRDRAGLDPKDVCILFFERNGLDVNVSQLVIDDKGNILGAPSGYRNFFLQEQLRAIA
jgi:AAA ATPase domain